MIQLSKVHKIFLITMSVLVVLELLYFIIIAPRSSIKKVILKNDLSLSDEQLLDLIGLKNGSSYFAFNTRVAKEHVKKTISVKKVSIEKFWPSTVKVTLEGFSAIGRLKNSDGSIFYINNQGILFTQNEHTDTSNPWINGLNIVNNTIADNHKTVLDDLMFLKKSNIELFSFIESVQIADKQIDGNVHYVVKFKGLDNPILWGSRLSEQKLYNSLLLANLIKNIPSFNKELIDFRTDEIVYKTGGHL